MATEVSQWHNGFCHPTTAQCLHFLGTEASLKNHEGVETSSRHFLWWMRWTGSDFHKQFGLVRTNFEGSLHQPLKVQHPNLFERPPRPRSIPANYVYFPVNSSLIYPFPTPWQIPPTLAPSLPTRVFHGVETRCQRWRSSKTILQ